jgi:hypothetical protein
MGKRLDEDRRVEPRDGVKRSNAGGGPPGPLFGTLTVW